MELLQKIKHLFKYKGFKPEVVCIKNKCKGWTITWLSLNKKDKE